MQDKALQSEKMQDNPAKSRTVGNSAISESRWLSAFVEASQFRKEKRRNVDVFCRSITCRYVFRILKFYWGLTGLNL